MTRRILAFVLAAVMLIGTVPVHGAHTQPVHAAQAHPTFVVDTVNASAGETVDVTIRLQNNPGVTSIKLLLEYDDALTLTGVVSNPSLGTNFLCSPDGVYPAILNWYDGLKNVTGDWVFVTLTFAVAEDAQGTCPISITYDANDVFDVDEENVHFDIQNGGVTVGCAHSSLTEVPAKAAGCETEGNIAYYTCACGAWFADAKGTQPITDKSSVILNKLGHSFTNYVKDNPGAEGGTETAKCDRCDATHTRPVEGGQEGGMPTFVVDTVSAAAGETVDVTVRLQNNPGVTSIKLSLEYDDALTLQNVVSNPTLGDKFLSSPEGVYPVILNWYDGLKNVTGDWVFVTLTFAVAEGAQGTCPIRISYDANDVFDVDEENVHFDIQNGGVTVGCREDADHRFPDEYISDNNASCTADGTKHRVCTLCGEKETVTDVGSALGHDYASVITEPTCTDKGYTTHTCTRCGDNYVDSYVESDGEHRYDDGVCVWCGRSKLGSDWLVPEFAQGDYTMVILPDTQNMITYHSGYYYQMMQWIADNRDTLNIEAVLHMGDMVNSNTAAEWTVCKNGTNILQEAGIPWMPMRGNHDDSAGFNKYYDYATYGTNQSWFGGSYHADKLDHTYWFVTAGEREYVILSLGWAPSWDVLAWAQGIVEANRDKSVILTSHAYMNKDGTLLSKGDAYCVSSYLPGYPNGDDVWAAFKGYDNVVLAMGGHISSPDIVTYVDQNGAGKDVYSLLVDNQDEDTQNRLGMVLVLTFHNGSDKVDLNWYSTRYDALYGAENQFSITVPELCDHVYKTETVEATCTQSGGTVHSCTKCAYSYTENATEALGHDYKAVVTAPTCTQEGYTTLICSRCGDTQYEMLTVDITDAFVWTDGQMILATTGECTPFSTWQASDYVDISAYSELEILTANTISKNTTTGLAFYDADKNYISGITHTDYPDAYGVLVRQIEIPENAVYIRSTWYGSKHTGYDSSFGSFYAKGSVIKTEPVLGHDYASVVTEPTCTEQGYTTHTCSRCGDSYVDSYVAATGHSWDKGVVTVEPTEESTGIRTYTCTVCGETKTEVIPQLDHVHSYTAVVTAPTCTEQGYTTHTCSCGDSYVDSYVAALGHKPVTDKAVAATCTQSGLTEGSHCDLCGTVLVAQKEIAALGHAEVVDAAVSATCTEPGLTKGTHCDRCGTILTAQTVIPAKGHTEVIDKAVAATCTDTGLSEGKHCSVCNTVLSEQKVIPALGHSYKSTVVAPGAETQGYTEHVCSVCGHSYRDSYTNPTGHNTKLQNAVDATCTTAGYTGDWICTDCGKVIETGSVIPALGHKAVTDKAVAATCTETGLTEGEHCSVCGEVLKAQTVIPAKGHSYGDWYVTKSATCAEAGQQRRDCEACSHYETAPIPAKGHVPIADGAVEATCTATGLTAGEHCLVCGEVLKAQTVISAKGHSYGEWYETKAPTCTAKGSEQHDCSNCDYFETREVAATGHSYQSVVTAPTCTEGGYTTHTCACGESYVDAYKSATGHKWDGGVVTQEPTDRTEGVRTYTCSICGSERTESIPKLEHTHMFSPVVTKPTCTEEGYTTYLCSCGASYVTKKTDPLGHSWSVWTVIREPNYLEDGVKERHCSRCEASEPQAVENNPFVDVKPDRFEEPILWAYYEGITTGTGDGTTFSPENPCTRKQIVTFLWRAAGQPKPKSMINPFKDVKNDRFEEAILWAYYEGITTGTGDGTTFSPEDPCTRKQIVTFLWRAAGQPKPKSMINPFKDVKNDRFEEAILWAYYEGITTGTGDGTTFSPEDPCTRKQIVTFLYRSAMEEQKKLVVENS